MIRYPTTIILSLFFIYLSGQSEAPSKLIISESPAGNFYFEYSLIKGETAYSASRKFSQSMESILRMNEGKDLSKLGQNEIIKIPYSKELLIDPLESSSTALVYVTKPKETLYSIGKRYFQIDVEDIQSLNNLKDNQLSIGQELIIGYTDFHNSLQQNEDGTRTEDTEIVTLKPTPIMTKETINTDENIGAQINSQPEMSYAVEKNFTISELIEMIDDDTEYIEEDNVEEVLEELEYSSQKGLAFTENAKMDGNDLFVLHSEAEIGSELEITYPMLDRTIKAKVIGEIPKELYPKNISVVISPGVATALGAKDAQFRVEMKYLTN